MSNSESKDQPGSDVPSSRLELGSRLSLAVNRIGGNVAAGKIAGVTPEQIATWKKGGAKIPLEAAIKIAAAAEVRLDWLADGTGPMDANEIVMLAEGPAIFQQRQALDEVGKRLRMRHEIFEAAVSAAGYRPSRVIEEMLKTLIFRGGLGLDAVEDLTLLLDAMKNEDKRP